MPRKESLGLVVFLFVFIMVKTCSKERPGMWNSLESQDYRVFDISFKDRYIPAARS